MNRFDEMFDFEACDNNDQDVSLVAVNHLFSNGPDLFGHELSDELTESMASPRPAGFTEPFADETSHEHTSLLSSGGEYFDQSFDLFQKIDFGNDNTVFASLSAPQSMAQQSDDVRLGLIFDPTHPAVPLMPTPTVAPAALSVKTLPYPQIVPASVTAPNGVPLWPLIGMDNLPQASDTHQQQSWQVSANQQTQLFQPQPNAAQVQYMQAIQQWQIVENQPALSLQSSFQSPANGRSPQNVQSTQNSQQARDSPQQENILSDEQLALLQNGEHTECAHLAIQEPPRHAPNAAVLPTSTTPCPTVPPTAVSHGDDQEEWSEDIPRPHKACTKSTSRNVRIATPVQYRHDESLPQTLHVGLTFANLRQAETSMTTRYLESDWQAPSPDNTVPNTHQDRAKYVVMMFNAFQDTSECKDNQEGFSFLKRWLRPGYYNVQEMEKVCWHMLDIAERLHAHGPYATNIYCQDALKKLKASRGLTFEQRIVAICDMLKLSKFLCDNLMKGEGIEALVGAPKQKMSGAKTMMVQNQKRQKWIAFGRNEAPLHLAPGEDGILEPDEQNVIVNMANVSEPTQCKTKPKSKRSAPATTPRAKTNARSRTATREDSDDEDEHPVLLRRQSIFDNNVVDESDLEMADELQRFISSKPSPAPRTPSASPGKTSENAFSAFSVASPVFPLPPISAPVPLPTVSNYLGLPSAPASPASPESSLKPMPSTYAPSSQVRIPHAEIEAAGARAAEPEGASPKPISKNLEELRARRLARAAAEMKTNGQSCNHLINLIQSGKRAIGLSESESKDEQPDPPAKRQRKNAFSSAAREATPLSSDDGDESDASDKPGAEFLPADADEQDADEGEKSDQQANETESDNDEDTNEDDGDIEGEDQDEEGASQQPEVASPTRPPSTNRKRKRNDMSKSGHNTFSTWPLVAVNLHRSKKSKKPEHQDQESEDKAAPLAKRAKKGNDEPTHKSTTPAPASKNFIAKKDKPQQDAQGRFVRHEVAAPAASIKPVAPARRVTCAVARAAVLPIARRNTDLTGVACRKGEDVGRK
ncbi:hypothetical protein BU25DRAFT_451553 [Macroventuria anomochaeta]|uniref:Uncharacterized protein n=1 Tax=Macroventuria anomochaeta TaxID=301207 RepID=A0ACB6RML1_9PLEO|nr:uncharacterized protein BU25DRAFT_451553 [Macroventuria anomochaeta]KAF2623116.1 hypothetical protein BU25DRAFT_451553 [Macroventuria anomochaeta]